MTPVGLDQHGCTGEVAHFHVLLLLDRTIVHLHVSDERREEPA